ncbi:YeiH family protein [Rhizobium sp. L1K21]|uniref:YeiH family protein n=1 Tax=Rhizobium sp. L1K21 TaxID=2954933 RepID=UPI002092077F|nr:putative sulfate exporter family transporter [Rhizobium sp. L1K21]MCO6184919.1 putative sulfate exporter family transporter [Rhizobium sp. L1K21]
MLVQNRLAGVGAGVALSVAVALAGYGAELGEKAFFGNAWLESLVLAILIGAAIRTVFGLHPRFHAGIHFSAKFLLEVAIVLLGASISLSAISSAGLPLIVGIAGSVMGAIMISYLIGRMLKLEHRLALLVACGNSICGNSAIVSVAPVIDAEADDVTASIAFTAALGILVVLLLPLAQHFSGMSAQRYGILSGMTVYAVPQVLAATAPIGLVSMQTGTLVKLVRVIMLAPVIFMVGLLHRSKGEAAARGVVRLGNMVPWFIVGFALMMGLRSLELIPQALQSPISSGANILTVISMAALGLSADLRTIVQSGGRVLFAGLLSLMALAAISIGLLDVLGIH